MSVERIEIICCGPRFYGCDAAQCFYITSHHSNDSLFAFMTCDLILSVSWREWMTDRCLQLYSSNRVYYNLERGSEIDNPDQRITEDVRSFTAFSLTLFLTLLTSLIDLVSFSLILYSIQPQLFGAIAIYGEFSLVFVAQFVYNAIDFGYAYNTRC